ncbi:MAG: hypothetical protein ACP5PJ_00075 [Acidimicrobiales bacterium]
MDSTMKSARQGKRAAPRAYTPAEPAGSSTPPPSPFRVIASVGAVCIGLGYAFELVLAPAVASKMLPWAVGRALGISSLIDLWALVCLGMLYRSPRMRRLNIARPGMILRVHQALAASGGVLLAMHIISLLLDRYAGVGVLGAFVPGLSGFRTLGVALGTIALYLGVLIGGSAALSGIAFGRRWYDIHKLALLMFLAAWLHGLTAGTDATTLRPLYAILGATTVIAFVASVLRSRSKAVINNV